MATVAGQMRLAQATSATGKMRLTDATTTGLMQMNEETQAGSPGLMIANFEVVASLMQTITNE